MPTTLKNMPTLDLTHMSVEDLAEVEYIKNVALILATNAQASALAHIPTKNVASTVYVPNDAQVDLVTGLAQRGGDSFAPPDAHKHVLVVTGALIITSPLTDSKYREIHVSGGILAPYGSEDTLGAALTSLNGGVTFYRHVEGQQIKSLSGTNSVSGETLANANEGDILVVAGQLVITGQVTTLGYSQLIVSGQCIAPRESEPILGPSLTVQGQTLWYAGGNPRMFTGNESFGPDFFDYIDEPISLALIGDFAIERGVTAAVLKEKVAEISLMGRLAAPKELHGILQFLTVEKQGQILDDADLS